MAQSPKKFAEILTTAVRTIAARENKTIASVQDELGYALGRETGGSCIEYWRRGYVPSKPDELENLVRELVKRDGFLQQKELDQFLLSAGYLGLASELRSVLSSGELLPRPEQAPAYLATGEEIFPAREATTENHPAFLAGPPITHPRYFFGRERELKRLFGLLKRHPLQNAAVIGPRRSGKTSLLHYLKNITVTPTGQLRAGQRADWLPEPHRYRWIYVDFQDPRLGDQKGLLGYLLAQLQLPASPAAPQATVGLDHFIERVSQHLRQPTVILFDEIGVALQRYPELDDIFWEGLRALATNQTGGNLAFILAAHEAPDQLAHHSHLGSPFFNIFGYTATLGPFTELEAHELIASSPVPFAPADVEWILQASKGWPLLLQILSRERWLALEDGEPETVWQEEALRQLGPFRHLG